jgi:23S rRNA (cytidine1920-2'-O)/16S rRNA (cytidine1409-2'-O)-methyltransferase
VKDCIALDCGISTGGFTDCLLKRGAKHVYGVDVGYGDVAWGVRNHPAVTLIERTNFRLLFEQGNLKASLEDQLVGQIDLVTLDLSFISVCKVLEVVKKLLKPAGQVLILVKPQFELQKQDIGKGGIVRDPALHRQAIDRVSAALMQAQFEVCGEAVSEVVGSKGNQEFFLLARKST